MIDKDGFYVDIFKVDNCPFDKTTALQFYARTKMYHKLHPEVAKRANDRYREKHRIPKRIKMLPEEKKAIKAEWYQKNKIRITAQRKARYAKRKGTLDTLTR